MGGVKHTAGPWFIAANDAECVVFREGDQIASRDNFIDCNTAANARLIAAAPDLLEAAKAVAASSMRNEAYDICVAAIAKATGEKK